MSMSPDEAAAFQREHTRQQQQRQTERREAFYADRRASAPSRSPAQATGGGGGRHHVYDRKADEWTTYESKQDYEQQQVAEKYEQQIQRMETHGRGYAPSGTLLRQAGFDEPKIQKFQRTGQYPAKTPYTLEREPQRVTIGDTTVIRKPSGTYVIEGEEHGGYSEAAILREVARREGLYETQTFDVPHGHGHVTKTGRVYYTKRDEPKGVYSPAAWSREHATYFFEDAPEGSYTREAIQRKVAKDTAERQRVDVAPSRVERAVDRFLTFEEGVEKRAEKYLPGLYGEKGVIDRLADYTERKIDFLRKHQTARETEQITMFGRDMTVAKPPRQKQLLVDSFLMAEGFGAGVLDAAKRPLRLGALVGAGMVLGPGVAKVKALPVMLKHPSFPKAVGTAVRGGVAASITYEATKKDSIEDAARVIGRRATQLAAIGVGQKITQPLSQKIITKGKSKFREKQALQTHQVKTKTGKPTKLMRNFKTTDQIQKEAKILSQIEQGKDIKVERAIKKITQAKIQEVIKTKGVVKGQDDIQYWRGAEKAALQKWHGEKSAVDAWLKQKLPDKYLEVKPDITKREWKPTKQQLKGMKKAQVRYDALKSRLASAKAERGFTLEKQTILNKQAPRKGQWWKFKIKDKLPPTPQKVFGEVEKLGPGKWRFMKGDLDVIIKKPLQDFSYMKPDKPVKKKVTKWKYTAPKVKITKGMQIVKGKDGQQMLQKQAQKQAQQSKQSQKILKAVKKGQKKQYLTVVGLASKDAQAQLQKQAQRQEQKQKKMVVPIMDYKLKQDTDLDIDSFIDDRTYIDDPPPPPPPPELDLGEDEDGPEIGFPGFPFERLRDPRKVKTEAHPFASARKYQFAIERMFKPKKYKKRKKKKGGIQWGF